MELAVVPIFQSEITPQKARGFIVGTYQLSLVFGGLIINVVARGTSDIKSNAAWQIPIGLFYVVPVFVVCTIWFVPEVSINCYTYHGKRTKNTQSPRWLILKGRRDDALKSLTRLREGKFSQDEIEEEFSLISIGIEQEVEQGTFFEMFKGAVNTKRSLIVFGANFFLQATGATFASVYGALFIKSVGTVNTFTVTCSMAGINTVICMLSMVLVDKIGRRYVPYSTVLVKSSL